MLRCYDVTTRIRGFQPEHEGMYVGCSKCSHDVLRASTPRHTHIPRVHCDTTGHHVSQERQRDTATIVTETNQIANNTTTLAVHRTF